jgi:hypothetical protein
MALSNLLVAIKAKDTQAILGAVIALLNVMFTPQLVQAAAGDGDCSSLVSEIESCCKEGLTVASPGTVGKLGDGAILKLILQLLPLILPLILEPKPAA